VKTVIILIKIAVVLLTSPLGRTGGAFSQTQFQHTIGGTGGEYCSSIIQTADGGYAVAGYTNSFGAGGNDFYIVKLAGTGGTLQWTRTIGGAGNDIALSIIQTADGGYAVSGETTSFGAGNFDAYIMKLDYNGMLQWSRTVGGAGDEYGESIIQTPDGGYAVASYTTSFGAGDYDVYIIKLDAAGMIQWSRTIGGPGYDYALSIIQTTDDGYALFGSTGFYGAGYTDYYVVKLDSNGSLQWSKTIGGTGGDYGFSIVQALDGGYALSGTTVSFGAGNLDIYIVKLDHNGSLQWTRTVGGTEHDYGYVIIQTTDGGYAVSGSTASFGAGGNDAYIVKLNSSGSLQWSKTAGGMNYDYTLSIIQTTDGGYAAADYSASFGAGDADIYIVKLDAAGNTCGNTSSPLPSSGTGGTLGSPASITTSPTPSVSSPSPSTGTGGVLTTLCFVGIQPISNELPGSYRLYQNYPNPFNPSTKIKFDVPTPLNPPFSQRGEERSGGGFVTLTIYDILGREIATLVDQQLKPGSYEVEWSATGGASNYPSGVYFYKLVTNEFFDTKKMILMK
jgi:hypothetical protein